MTPEQASRLCAAIYNADARQSAGYTVEGERAQQARFRLDYFMHEHKPSGNCPRSGVSFPCWVAMWSPYVGVGETHEVACLSVVEDAIAGAHGALGHADNCERIAVEIRAAVDAATREINS